MNNPRMSTIIEGLGKRVNESFIVPQNSDKTIPNGYQVFDCIELIGTVGAIGGNSPPIGTYWKCISVLPSMKHATYAEIDYKKFIITNRKFVTMYGNITHGIAAGDVRVLDVGEELISVADKLSTVKEVIINLGIDKVLNEKINKIALKEGCMVLVDMTRYMLDDSKLEGLLTKLQDVLLKRGLKSGIKNKYVLYIY